MKLTKKHRRQYAEARLYRKAAGGNVWLQRGQNQSNEEQVRTNPE